MMYKENLYFGNILFLNLLYALQNKSYINFTEK